MVERMRRTKSRKASMKGGEIDLDEETCQKAGLSSKCDCNDIEKTYRYLAQQYYTSTKGDGRYDNFKYPITNVLPLVKKCRQSAGTNTSIQTNEVTEKLASTNNGAEDKAGGDSEKPRGMSEAFAMVYKVCALLSVLIIFILTIVSVIDVVTFLVGETTQRFKARTDPSFMNNRTTDVKSLQYLLNNPEDEPYSVFMEQNLLVSLFLVIGFAVGLFGIQIAIFLGMKVYAAARSKPNDEKLSIPFVYMALLLIALVLSLVLIHVYKYEFIQGTQETMRVIKSQMRDVKNTMYLNMSNDPALLDALKRDDTDAIVNVMNNNKRNLTTLRRMIITYNVYQFFTTIVPESDPNYDKMMQIFTYEGIQKQKVDPTMLFIYKQANFITDGYSASLQDRLILPSADGSRILNDVTSIMKDLNKKVVKIQDISGGKRNLFKYMFKIMIINVIFLGILLIIVYFTLRKDYPEMMASISKGFASILPINKTQQ